MGFFATGRSSKWKLDLTDIDDCGSSLKAMVEEKCLHVSHHAGEDEALGKKHPLGIRAGRKGIDRLQSFYSKQVKTGTNCNVWFADEIGHAYWASRELGLSMTKIAKRLGLTQPAVSIAARRGEEIARQEGYSLLEN